MNYYEKYRSIFFGFGIAIFFCGITLLVVAITQFASNQQQVGNAGIILLATGAIICIVFFPGIKEVFIDTINLLFYQDRS